MQHAFQLDMHHTNIPNRLHVGYPILSISYPVVTLTLNLTLALTQTLALALTPTLIP